MSDSSHASSQGLTPRVPGPRVAVVDSVPERGPQHLPGGRDFRKHLPSASIYVYDNRSSDGTAAAAREAGAIVRHELWPGKGNVVRRMFADVDADIYLMADGDGTYDASSAPGMVERLVVEQVDMVVGARKGVRSDAHRRGHGFGNRLFNLLYRRLIGPDFTDIFSGYRVFSRRFVKSFPAISSGFEIEAEMSVHASQLRMPIAEMETDYRERLRGSQSKLRTFRDALRILTTLVRLFKEIRPLLFYGSSLRSSASLPSSSGCP